MERAVETNQKHLIKKILARYPAQWTFFRELIQNSDDAQASESVIEFATYSPNPNSSSRRVKHTTVSNNGNTFSPQDWTRLCSIASGNPDPNKVGFFGVGFYSVFALSDSPTVLSGEVSLDFFWKGNALFTRETKREAADGWTRFLLPRVEDSGEDEAGGSPLPNFDEIGQFLCELLCFARHLRTVRVVCDGVLQVTARRDDIPFDAEECLPLPSGGAVANALASTFGTTGVRFAAHASAPLPVLSQTIITLANKTTLQTISLLRASAKFQSKVSSHYAKQYLEMTQKPHPSQIDLSILVSLDRGLSTTTKASTSLDKINPNQCRGKVFVGFVTSQTTGLGAHVSGPFIPTMEREHLDFSNEMAKAWNLALCQTTGWLCRVVHDSVCNRPKVFAALIMSESSAVVATVQAPPAPPPPTSTEGGFWNSLTKATAVMFSALVVASGGGDEGDTDRSEDDALFSSLERDSGAIVVSSMASFCPVASECRPFPKVLSAIWSGFVDGEMFESGPLVWTCQGAAMSCDKARLFPSSSSSKTALPPLASIETFPVVASQLSRPVVDAASRSTASLVSTLLHQLVASNKMFYFELKDIVSELKLRPLRGLDETAGVLNWFVEQQQQAANRKITVRCSNCSAQCTAVASKPSFACPTCYCRLTLPASAFSSSTAAAAITPQDDLLKKALWQHARCELEPGVVYEFSKWQFALDSALDKHASLVSESLPRLKHALCPLAVSSKCALPDSLVQRLTVEMWIQMCFASNQQPDASVSGEVAFKLLYYVCFDNGKFDSDSLKTLACVPTTASTLAVPPLVYTTEIEEEKDALVLAKLPGFVLEAKAEQRFMGFLKSLGVRESVSPLAMVKLFLRGSIKRQALWAFLHQHLVRENTPLEPQVVHLLQTSKCAARAGTNELYLPGQLLLPSPALLELASELPVLLLDEPGLLPFFTKELKLPAAPSNDALLSVASSTKSPAAMRIKALRVLHDNNRNNAQVFASTKLPILPCVGGTWSAPKDCYLQVPAHLASSCVTCDVAQLSSEFTDVKQQLGVAPFPPLQLSIDCLAVLAQQQLALDEVIDYLVEMQSHLVESEYSQVQKLRIVPIPPTCGLYGAASKFQLPPLCYFENKDDDDSSLGKLFCFVSESSWKKSSKHQYFYQRLGIRQAPTLNEVAQTLATRPKQTLQSIGPVEYQDLLRLIAGEASKLKKDVLKEMQASACLVGLSNNGSVIGLHFARDVVVEDDSRYRRLFPMVPSCPSDVALERLYLALGSSNISAVVEETSRPDSDWLPLSPSAIALDEQLCHRLPVLTQKCAPGEVIKDRVESWNKRAKDKRANKDFGLPGTSLVKQVGGIHCELKLRLGNQPAQSAVMSSTCCLFQDHLCVTKVDYFHVASALVGALLRVRSNDRAFLWASLLQTSDTSLEDMGFVLPKEPVVVSVAKPVRFGVEEKGSGVLPSGGGKVEEKAPKVEERAPNSGKVEEKPPAVLPPPKLPPKVSGSVPPSLPPPVPPKGPGSLPPSLPSPMPKLPTTSKNNGDEFPSSAPPPPTAHPTPNTSAPPPTPPKLVPPNMDRFRDSAISKALENCRACDSSSIVDKGQQVPIRDAMLDCTQPHDLVRDPEGVGSIECFVPRELQHYQTSPFQLYMAQGREFANLLLQMGVEVFQLDPNVLHLFFDPRGITRAFNLGGALFFNLYCFVHDGDSLKLGKSWKRWFGTFCHELSHNCWKAHDAQFANYIEVFCVEFSESLHQSLRLRGLM